MESIPDLASRRIFSDIQRPEYENSCHEKFPPPIESTEIS